MSFEIRQGDALEQLREMPLTDWAEEAAHLYIWTTNQFMVEAHDLASAWDFKVKTILTWVKTRIGMGTYYRNNTEHLLFGLTGSQRLLRFDVGTWFTAARPGQHSAKPQEAYDMIASCSPGPRLDMFARIERDGFTSWGNMP